MQSIADTEGNALALSALLLGDQKRHANTPLRPADEPARDPKRRLADTHDAPGASHPTTTNDPPLPDLTDPEVTNGEFIRIPAFRLVAGDVIGHDGHIGRLTRDPEMLHRGLSLFDELQVFLGISLQTLDRDSSHYLILEPAAMVIKARTANSAHPSK